MVMTCVKTVLVFPQLSVTCQVFVYEPASGHDPAINAPAVFTMLITFGSQLSVATGNIACANAIPAALLH